MQITRYLKILRLTWRQAYVNKGAGFIYLLLSLLNIFLALAIWSIAYQNPTFGSTQKYSAIVSYFFLILFLNPLVFSRTADEVANEHIIKGELSMYLLKPFPYFLFQILSEIPWRVIQFSLSLPAVILLLYLQYENILVNPFVVIAVIPLLVVAYIISFLIQMMVAMSAFWLNDVKGLLQALEILEILFYGIGIPVFFFPPVLKAISSVLPFQYLLYFPISMIMERISFVEIVQNLLIMGSWLLFLILVNRSVWKHGIKHFTGEGI